LRATGVSTVTGAVIAMRSLRGSIVTGTVMAMRSEASAPRARFAPKM
jgi:predicted aconitase with swiveling domain